MKKRMLSLTLLLTLLLTACGGSTETQQSQASSLLESAAGIEETTPLLTVDGREIPAWRYLYWLAETCAAIEEEYAEAGMEVDWNAAAEGMTLKEYAKEQALEATAVYAAVENWGEAHHCMIAENPEAAVKFPANWELSDEQTDEMETVGLLYRELYRLFCTEGSTLAPDEKAVAAFAEKQEWVGMEQIFISAAENREEAKEQAVRWFAGLNAAEDPSAEFAAFAAEDDDPTGARTIRLGSESLDQTLEAALRGLETGQLSGILETEDGYHILRRIQAEPAVFMEAFFDDALRQAAEQAEIRCTQTYKDLDAKEFYAALLKGKRGETPKVSSD